MDVLVELGLVVALVAGVIVAMRHRYQFLIKIRVSEAHVVRGKVTSAFLHHISEVCRQHGVTTGWIGGVRTNKSKRPQLEFSSSFPKWVQQQIRNEWVRCSA